MDIAPYPEGGNGIHLRYCSFRLNVQFYTERALFIIKTLKAKMWYYVENKSRTRGNKNIRRKYFFLSNGATATSGPWPPLDEWSGRRWDLYLTTHNTHKRQTSMPPGENRTHNPSKRAAADHVLDHVAVSVQYLVKTSKEFKKRQHSASFLQRSPCYFP
jgi:hypothetical protein